MAMDAKPIKATQVTEPQYNGRYRPSPYVIVGDIDGHSGVSTPTYQDWLDAGNSGTRQDFLDSLVGPQGPQGPQGAQGPQGPQGPKGSQGPEGAEGPQGPRGDTGPEGPQGPTGATGGIGGEGVQGPPGPRGADGTSVVIDGYAESVADLPDLTGDPAGPSYIVMETGHIYYWNGTSFTDGGNVTGPRGADGAPGVQGPRGQAGPQGIQGPQGLTGTTGATGATGATGPRGASNVTVYVTDFGADITGVNDSTESIRTAMAALPATGGTVLFPAGRYRIDNAIRIPSNTTMLGEGAVITKPLSTSGEVLFYSRAGTVNIAIKNFRIEGNLPVHSVVLYWGHRTSRILIEDVDIEGAIRISSNITLMGCTDVIIQRCTFTGASASEAEAQNPAIQIREQLLRNPSN